MAENVRFDNPILHAIAEFKAAGFTYGKVIPTEWFMDRFGIKPWTNVHEYNQAQTLYATYMGQFRNKLLIEMKMALRTKPGHGQEVVLPTEQTSWAMDEAKSAITKELEKARDRLTYVNTAELNDAERKENTDAIAKLSFFSRKAAKELP